MITAFEAYRSCRECGNGSLCFNHKKIVGEKRDEPLISELHYGKDLRWSK